MLVDRSGKVTCNKRHCSFWGCGKTPSHGTLFVVLTDENNKILAPEGSRVNKRGQYTLTGYTSSSSALVLCASKKPHCVFANRDLRLWYGEDLRGLSESDNGGKTCADV